MGVPAARFWGEVNPAIAQSLSADQRAEIERVLALDPARWPNSVGDLRLSFYFFFLRLMWGREKRGADRLKQERTIHPVMTRKNAPAIVAVSLGYTAFWYAVLVVIAMLFARYVLR